MKAAAIKCLKGLIRPLRLLKALREFQAAQGRGRKNARRAREGCKRTREGTPPSCKTL